MRTDSVSANASDAWGGAGILFAQEPSLDGKLFRNSAFTEIVIGWEIWNQSDKNDISIFYQALRRLVYTYRYLTPDLRASLGPALKGHVQTIRRGSCIYKNPRAATAIDRLQDNEPQYWRLEILSTKGYASGVAAHSAQFGTVEARAMNLGSYLMDGFVLPETVAALEAIAEEALTSGNYRSAVVEAMSLTELAILAAWRRFRSQITLTKDIDDPYGHDWRFLSEKLTPVILSLYNGNRAPLLKRLHRIVKVRHCVVHRGYRPVADEADDVLSTARTLIRVLEIPSKYRANWPLKPGLPEPVPSEA